MQRLEPVVQRRSRDRGSRGTFTPIERLPLLHPGDCGKTVGSGPKPDEVVTPLPRRQRLAVLWGQISDAARCSTLDEHSIEEIEDISGTFCERSDPDVLHAFDVLDRQQ